MSSRLRARASGASPEEATEALEIDLLLAGVARHSGYDFRGYARAAMRGRVRQAVLQEGVASASTLQERVLRDEAALNRFVAIVALRRAPMFSNPEMYLAFRREVVPLLRTYPFTGIWVAGCSMGEELYSLAILLHEEGLLGRCRLYATDMSDALVGRASEGRFALSDMLDFAVAYQQAGGCQDFAAFYRREGDFAVFEEHLRRNVVFSKHNLVSDGAFNEFQVVVCRNLMRDLDPQLRERVQNILHASLVRLGVLALGARESLSGTDLEGCYRQLSTTRVGLYRRMR